MSYIQPTSSGGPAFTDSFSLGVKAADSNTAPTDAATFAMALLEADTTTVPTDTLKLGFPAPDFADSSTAPTDSNSVALKVWLSGSTVDSTNGVTNVANMNGVNNGTVATFQSAAAGDTNPRTHSALGANVPTFTVSTATLNGWYKSVNTLGTSTTTIKVHSLTGLFSDLTVFSNSGISTTVDHLTDNWGYDMISAGIDTLAKLQSAQLLCATSDIIAGTTPAVLTVDAFCFTITGTF
jgi:hypothetical protein